MRLTLACSGTSTIGLWRVGISKKWLHARSIDAIWVLFLTGSTSAFTLFGVTEFYFWFPAYFVVTTLTITRLGAFSKFAWQNKLLLGWPALACLSFVWSLAPGMSLYHGLQLLMTTLMGFTLCIYESRTKILQLIFAALIICAVASLIVVSAIPTSELEGWKGVFHHKNQLGAYMALLALTSICLTLQGWRPLLTAASTALALTLLLASRSGTALLCVSLALASLPLGFCLRQGRSALSTALGVMFILAAVGFFVAANADINAIDPALQAFGKDRTLTGRTILWDFGMQAFLSHPLLGLGYKGYWEGSTSTVYYLRHVSGDLWFFHNNILEVAVAFGIIGPVLLLAVVGQAFARSVRAFIADGQYTTFWSLLIVLFMAMYMMAENPLFENHSFYQVLFIVAAADRRRSSFRSNPHREMYLRARQCANRQIAIR